MADSKRSFVLYADLLPTIKKMPKEKAGELLLAILEYVNDLNPTVEDLMVDLVFEPIKQQLKRDLKRWEGIKEKRSEAGKASAEAKKVAKESQQKSTNPTHVDFVQQTSTKSTVSVNVNDSVSVNVNEIKKEDIYKENPAPEIDEEKKSNMINTLVEQFGFSEMKYKQQKSYIMSFVTNLFFKNQQDDFIKQYLAYCEFKKLSKQIVHSYDKLMGDASLQFEDGAWKSKNWEHELKEIKNKTDGTRNNKPKSIFAD